MNRLSCHNCGAIYSLNDPRWKCDCGSYLDIEFEPAFSLEEKGEPTMWRYRDAIPIEDDWNIVSFGEGFTPLNEVEIAGRPILIKQEQLLPTGSFKDRGASVLVSKLKELGVGEVVEDSSGNAGLAISAYCAKAGIRCHIFVPQGVAAGKLAHIRSYGARLTVVRGSREDTASAALEAAENSYYASHSWNPFFMHGAKTFAYEVCEQLGWRSPDTVVLPVGNGTLLLGAYIGFAELLHAKIIDAIPRFIAVQAANCAPLYKAFRENLEEIPTIDKIRTLAEGIAIARPIRGKQILDAVRQSKGDFISVDEDEIARSLRTIYKAKYFIEPTSAATIAGLEKYLQESRPDEVIVSVFTGHGLKAPDKLLNMLKN